MKSLAALLDGRTDLGPAELERDFGAYWDGSIACFILDDESAVRFSDLLRGAVQRRGDGSPHVHIEEVQ